MEPNIGDDARKKRQSKRDCAEVVEHHAQDSSGVCEKTRKLRKYSPTTTDETTSSKVVKTSAAASTKASPKETAAAATEVPASVVVTKAAAAKEQTNASPKATLQLSPACEPKEHSTKETATATREAPKHPATGRSTTTVGKQDLESALHYVVTIGEGRSEPLSDHTTLSFRVGHAGDASTLATWYRNTGGNNDASRSTLGSAADNPTATGSTDKKAREENSPSATSNTAQQQATDDDTPSPNQIPATTTTCLDQGGSSSLDLWLVDGLGDEDIPPSLFALIADMNTTTTTTNADSPSNNNSKSSQMAAVALLTSSWENSSRVLRLEWFQIDDSLDQSKLVERRMWLRLSLLSLVTSSELRVVDPSTNALTAATTQTQVPLQP